MIKTKRAFDPPAADDGVRYLVDRIWPRGIKKAELQADEWLKEVAPSTALRKWFGHDPSKWAEFQERYESELAQNPSAWLPILEAVRQQDRVTLLYAARDQEHNNAVALKGYIERKLAEQAAR